MILIPVVTSENKVNSNFIQLKFSLGCKLEWSLTNTFLRRPGRSQYPCRQWNHQATSKGNLAEQKRQVHEGVKYPCGQCNYQAKAKRSLAKHKRAKHEGIKYP